MRYMDDAGLDVARAELAGWARNTAQLRKARDRLVRWAYDAGVGKSEIHRLTGIGRATINRILKVTPRDDRE